jgi:hypothetical protein
VSLTPAANGKNLQPEKFYFFYALVLDTGGNVPQMMLTPVANLPPVSLILVVHLDF